MRVVIQNHSTAAGDRDVDRAVAVIQHQIHEHLAPAWGLDAELVLAPRGEAVPAGSWLVTLLDRCDPEELIAFHRLLDAPVGFVGVKTAMEESSSWTGTLSHEVLELIVDPWATASLQVDTQAVALEICDPVEGQPYLLDGVEVSDFVLPPYYRPASTGPWNHNADKPLPGPLTLGPFGYFTRADLGEWAQVNASTVRPSKLEPGPGSRRARRRARAA